MARIFTSLGVSFLAITFAGLHPSTTNRAGTLRLSAPMLQARSGHTATLLPNGRVLIAGGMRRNQDFYKSAELYDAATGKFAPTGDMNERRVGHIAVLLRSGKVLVAGGWVGHGCTNSAELYDPATGKFSVLAARMNVARGNPRATLLPSGDVLVTGGADHDSPGGVASAEIFDASKLTFHAISPMHFARISHTATLLKDGRVLIVGGRGDRLNESAELYDPKTGRFELTGSLTTARYKHTAGLLPDGRVLIAGGSDERDWNGNLNSAEIYDPTTGRFASASPLNGSRFKLPEAAQLASGKLLVAGGNANVEVFDPSLGKFVVVDGQMNDSRHFMSETKLTDGSILLAGGYANNDQATENTWIYRP